MLIARFAAAALVLVLPFASLSLTAQEKKNRTGTVTGELKSQKPTPNAFAGAWPLTPGWL